MGLTFDIDEIYEIAEGVERNGAKFYRQAAQKSSDEETKKMLLELASMEEEHLEIFQQMREQLSEQEKTVVFDPDNQSALYLQAMADAHGWEGRISPTKELTGDEAIRDILEIALNSEKESVVFYFGLKGLISGKTGKKRVEQIIIEELSHITCLLNKLKSLK